MWFGGYLVWCGCAFGCLGGVWIGFFVLLVDTCSGGFVGFFVLALCWVLMVSVWCLDFVGCDLLLGLGMFGFA